ncbi:NUDIX hydrolase [Kribbella sp. CA-293567]|uniref:NUDIX hydrolase n=1 Tax=Kribbella sp. CA-293567 TaxID=3002436 RepID=UPI0022DD4D51|nr:NUDIX domain-containing protein [Kribbella sp. CA-293567]WBQ04837.1 NUDIX domain-containing protein [Kribbella sp. CA-293567]
MRVRAGLLRWGYRALRLWWKVRQPSSYGVKVLLVHPDDPSRCLVVRHSYVDRQWWALPGGGYNPKRETAEAAAIREVAEELSLTITRTPVVLNTLITDREGKIDSLTIFLAEPTSAKFRLNPELSEARWVSMTLAELPPDSSVSRWLKLALAAKT